MVSLDLTSSRPMSLYFPHFIFSNSFLNSHVYMTGKQAWAGMALNTLLQVYYFTIIIIQAALGSYLENVIKFNNSNCILGEKWTRE